MAIDTEKKKKIFYGAAVDNLVDPHRSTRWRMIIPADIFSLVGIDTTNGNSFSQEGGEDEFALLIQSGAKVPPVKTKVGKINYMGFEKKYPIQQDGLSGSMDLTALFLEDARGYEAITGWNQACLNTGILVNSESVDTSHDYSRTATEGNNQIYLGLGQQENSGNAYSGLLRNKKVRLELYDWMYGDVILSVNLINSWPSSVTGPEGLDYENAKLSNFKFTLTYDRFNVYIPSGYKSLGKNT